MCTLYPRRRLSHSSSLGFWIEYFSCQRATRSRPSHPLPLKNGCSSNSRFHRRKYFFWRDKFHETSLPRNWKQQIPLSRLLRNSLSRKIWYDYTLRMVASGTPYHEYRKLKKLVVWQYRMPIVLTLSAKQKGYTWTQPVLPAHPAVQAHRT